MYQFVQDVERSGGIHFMLLCMIGSYVTSTVESNFRFFHDFVCEKQVPTALVVTGLGKMKRMEDWWDQHKYHQLSPGVQMVAFDHACITLLPGDAADHQQRFIDSIDAIHLLLVRSIDGLDKRNPRAFKHVNVHQWFVSMAKQSMEFVLSPYREMLTEEGTVIALKDGCQLEDKEVRFLIGMIFLNEQEMEERIQKEEDLEQQEREEREAREREAREATGGEEARAEADAMEVIES